MCLPCAGANSWQSEDEPYTAVTFWMLVLFFAVGLCSIALGRSGRFHPRQPGLLLGVWVLLLVVRVGDYLAFYVPVYLFFRFNPQLLFGIIDMPPRYYIMLLDSRYWAQLNFNQVPCTHKPKTC